MSSVSDAILDGSRKAQDLGVPTTSSVRHAADLFDGQSLASDDNPDQRPAGPSDEGVMTDSLTS